MNLEMKSEPCLASIAQFLMGPTLKSDPERGHNLDPNLGVFIGFEFGSNFGLEID